MNENPNGLNLTTPKGAIRSPNGNHKQPLMGGGYRGYKAIKHPHGEGLWLGVLKINRSLFFFIMRNCYC